MSFATTTAEWMPKNVDVWAALKTLFGDNLKAATLVVVIETPTARIAMDTYTFPPPDTNTGKQ